MHSIVTDDMEHCLICGVPNVAVHHMINGNPQRKYSDEDGLVIPLCPKHHNMDSRESVHLNTIIQRWCKMLAQSVYMQNEVSQGLSVDEARQKFFKRYGKYYM
jgi:hypothetical protein